MESERGQEETDACNGSKRVLWVLPDFPSVLLDFTVFVPSPKQLKWLNKALPIWITTRPSLTVCWMSLETPSTASTVGSPCNIWSFMVHQFKMELSFDQNIIIEPQKHCGTSTLWSVLIYWICTLDVCTKITYASVKQKLPICSSLVVIRLSFSLVSNLWVWLIP